MSGLAKIVASIVSVPVAFVKEVVEDVKILEQEKAARVKSKMELPELTEDELQEVLRKRARNTASR